MRQNVLRVNFCIGRFSGSCFVGFPWALLQQQVRLRFSCLWNNLSGFYYLMFPRHPLQVWVCESKPRSVPEFLPALTSSGLGCPSGFHGVLTTSSHVSDRILPEHCFGQGLLFPQGMGPQTLAVLQRCSRAQGPGDRDS